MTTEEGALKTAIRKYLSKQGVYWVSVQAGPGAKPGDPDIIMCLNGRFIGIEAKARRGAQSPIQAAREKEIIASGGEYHIIRDIENIKELIKRDKE